MHTIHSKAYDFPKTLINIPDPPLQLYYIGDALRAIQTKPCVAVVGSRKLTAYGRAVTSQLVRELATAGVVVVSGLATGIDAVAHQAALDAGGITIAVMAGGLDTIYPRQHTRLAEQIIAQGGALLSEYSSGTACLKYNFVARNRLISGLCQAVLITEAAEKSGTLHTASFALEQGRDVLAVPGNVTSTQSVGTNKLIKAGAIPVTNAHDVFHILGITAKTTPSVPKGSTPLEQTIINLIASGETDGTTLLHKTNESIVRFNQALTMLEITGKIRNHGANVWMLT